MGHLLQADGTNIYSSHFQTDLTVPLHVEGHVSTIEYHVMTQIHTTSVVGQCIDYCK